MNNYLKGIIDYERYLDVTKKKRSKKYNWVNSIIVYAFPYAGYTEKQKELKYLPASFAKGYDYHNFVAEEIEKLLSFEHLTKRYKILVDIDFLDEKQVAQIAGLGQIGKNNLLLTKEFGSRVYLGTVVTEEKLEEHFIQNQNLCLNCTVCIDKCPSKALSTSMENCLSRLSQVDSVIFEQYDNLQTYYGCDVCQDVCPLNTNNFEYFKQANLLEKSVLNINTEYLNNYENLIDNHLDQTMNWIKNERFLRNVLVVGYNNKALTKNDLKKVQPKTEWLKQHIEYLLKKDDENGNN